ncbi:MAG TPA: LysE family transporter [Deltaproteobacteria bacterium]|nr:LysE family transporter [Deltaproteobacteria bacterium]HQJ09557.1 LysE family transporter [Deltaproteobacteria bacterium]
MIGFLAAVPIGPVNVLCIQRTLSQGRITGLISGLGAATIDAFYGGIAWLGISVISHTLAGYRAWINLFSGVFLLSLGIRIIIARSGEDIPPDHRVKGYMSAYSSTLLLTLANPSTIFSYGLLFAVFGGEHLHRGIGSASLIVPGVFIGSTVWWAFLSGFVDTIRPRMNASGLKWINRVSGAIIAGFGLFILTKML